MSVRRGPRSRQSGQATVEFALIVPLVVMLLLVVAQVAAIVYLQLAIDHLAREVARELVVNPDADIGHLTSQYSLLGHSDLSIETQILSTGSQGNGTIVVRVTHDSVAISKVFQRFLADVELSAEARMVSS